MLSQNRFDSISNLFSDKKVLIVGDLMLDRYYFGKTERMSPEAPVPVVDINKIVNSLGGSANVALNLSTLAFTKSIGLPLCILIRLAILFARGLFEFPATSFGSVESIKIFLLCSASL